MPSRTRALRRRRAPVRRLRGASSWSLVGSAALVGLVGAVAPVPPGPPAPDAAEVRPAALERPAPRVDGAASGERARRRATVDALVVLHRWDGRREAAWERADVAGLAALYTARSLAGRRDVARLRRYAARGWSVVGTPSRVVRADLAGRSAACLRLRLVEVGPSQHRVARVVVLVRRDDVWVVDRVLAP